MAKSKNTEKPEFAFASSQVSDIRVKTENDIEVIRNILTLNVYDCKNEKWTDKQITMRNILVKELHPKARMAIGAISKKEKNPDILKDFEGLSLDFSSGMRTHGYFLFTDSNIGSKYFGQSNAMGRINYGSLLMTECRVLYRMNISIAILEETPGNASDVERTKWVKEAARVGLGDSHGKISSQLAQKLSKFNEKFDSEQEVTADNPILVERDLFVPIQFRMAVPEKVLFKGTLATSTKAGAYDMIIPKSCIKAKKPKSHSTIVMNTPFVLGVVHEAINSSGKGGQMLWQWFDYEKSILLDIMPKTLEMARELAAATDSIIDLVKVLNVKEELLSDDQFTEEYASINEEYTDLDEQEEEEFEPESELNQSETEKYYDVVLHIVAADRYGQLVRHPWIVKRVEDRTRKRWLRLALNGAIRFRNLMGMPLDSIPENTFIAGELPLGFYIFFRNPIRDWRDIKVCENIKLNQPSKTVDIDRYYQHKGAIWMSHITASGVGGDFDGDNFNANGIDKMPHIAAQAAQFPQKYELSVTGKAVFKPEKQPIQGSLAVVAIRSMDSQVGIVADLMMRAQAINLISMELDFPKFNHSTGRYSGRFLENPDTGEEEYLGETTRMTIMEFLAQELQVAVDRAKNDLYHDRKNLNKVSRIIKSYLQAPWVSDRKNLQVYKFRAMYCLYGEDNEKVPVTEQGRVPEDTISQMVNAINQIWKPITAESGYVWEFRNLFPNADPESLNKTQKQLPYTLEMWKVAKALNASYGKRMKEIMEIEADTWEDEEEKRRLLEGLLKDVDNWKEEIVFSCKIAQEKFEKGENLAVGLDSKLKYGVKLKHGTEDELVPASIYDWACSFWDACHGKNAAETTTGGLVFRMFPQEIIKQLSQPGINRVELIDCRNRDLKYVIWGNPNTPPKVNEDGKPDVILAEPDSKEPENLYQMFPQNAKNTVAGMFFRNDDDRIELVVRSSPEKSWKSVGIVAKNQAAPELNKAYKVTLYTQEVKWWKDDKGKWVKDLYTGREKWVPNPSRWVSLRVLVVWVY